jgi:hypothetical protein
MPGRHVLSKDCVWPSSHETRMGAARPLSNPTTNARVRALSRPHALAQEVCRLHAVPWAFDIEVNPQRR